MIPGHGSQRPASSFLLLEAIGPGELMSAGLGYVSTGKVVFILSVACDLRRFAAAASLKHTDQDMKV